MPELKASPGQATASGAVVAWRMTRALVHIGLGALACALVFPLLNQRRRAPIVGWWARGFLAALGIRVQVRGAWPTQAGRYLLASNHITWLDIFVIHSVKPVRFVSKAEVRQWPLAGYLAHSAGTLFLDRTRKRDTVDIGAQMLEVLAAGQPIGIFPEGTTSDGSILLPFFSPLLQPAVNAQATLVPTAIRYRLADGQPNVGLAFIGEQTFLESVKITLRQPRTDVEVCFGAPLPSAGRHRRELTQQLEVAVAALLGVPVDRHWRAPQGPSGATGSAPQSSTPVHARSRQRGAAAADEDQATG